METIKNKAEINERFKSINEDLDLCGGKKNDKLLIKLATSATTKKEDGKCPNQYDQRWKNIPQSIPVKSGEVSYFKSLYPITLEIFCKRDRIELLNAYEIPKLNQEK